jgi:hypothetical protein
MTCPWTYKGEMPFPVTTCPILWHTLYPYFLGFVFGAKYSESGDCNVGCPAPKGIDLVVKKRPYEETPLYDERMIDIPENWRDVIHAEVVKVNGPCDYNHKVGDLVLFPTYAKDKYVCPARVYNRFLYYPMGTFKCIGMNRKLRCPDWKENII